MNYWPGAAVPVGGGGAWPGSEPTRRASRLAARTASGRAAAHGRTKQPGPATPIPPAPGKQPGHTATSTTTGAQATSLRPRQGPSARSRATPLQLGALEAEDVKELARTIR